MFRTKNEVDRHVAEILRKVKSDREKNLKCYNIALMYYKVRDYETAKQYVTMYLLDREDAPLANKLLGQIVEALGQREKAITSYKTSLEYDSNQPELVLKICELMCESDVTLDADRARYWCERGSEFFPHDPTIFRLKEKLLMVNGNSNSQAFEQLVNAELTARPTDPSIRIRLLKLYLETNRVPAAFHHAVEVEARQPFHNDLPWYKCFAHVCDIYLQQNSSTIDWQFYMHWLTVLDRAARLTLMEENVSMPTTVADCVQAVFDLDQALYKASNYNTSKESKQTIKFFKELLQHMSAQLYLHMGTWILKKAKSEHNNWKEASQNAEHLLSLAMIKPMDGIGVRSLGTHVKNYLQIYKDDEHYRVSQAGFVLVGIEKVTSSQKQAFSNKTPVNNSGYWRNRLFQRIFSTRDHRSAENTSYLVNCPFELHRTTRLNHNTLLSFTSADVLVPVYEKIHAMSLHYMTWLGVELLKINNCKLPLNFHTYNFKSTPITLNKVATHSVESLIRLDLDAFLYLTVFCAYSKINEEIQTGYHSVDRPSPLPADITSMLCTMDQSKWWTLACGVYNQNFKTDSDFVGDRKLLQHGIEVIRIIGNHGLDVNLVIKLARTFSDRASNEGEIALQERATMYWSAAVLLLEKTLSNKNIQSPTKCLFKYPKKELTLEEIQSLLEEGRYFIACQDIRQERYEKAVEGLKPLKSPRASYKLAEVYKTLADNEYNTRPPEDITSDIRSKHIILLTKARDCLYNAKDKIRSDKQNPLHSSVAELLEIVESALARIEPDFDGITSEVSSVELQTAESLLAFNLNTSKHNGQIQTTMKTSTPQKIHGHGDFRQHLISAPCDNSSQVELLANQKKILKKINLLSDLYQQLAVKVNSISEDLKKLKPSDQDDLYVFGEDEDYGDDVLGQYPTNFTAPFTPETNPFYYSSRRVQGTSTLTYGIPPMPPTVVPPPVTPQFFPPRVEPALAYQTPVPPPQLNYYAQNPLSFTENQQIQDFMRTSNIPKQPIPPVNVVITTSDTLPTGPPPVQPPMSVTIPLKHRLGTIPTHVSTSVSVPSLSSSQTAPSTPPVHNFQIKMPDSANIPSLEKSPGLMPDQFESDDESSPVVERDPYPDFKPIIPLPDEIVVKTGEEGETVLFENRAKLYRYVGKEWKERGVGILKILKNQADGKIRLLMRREQIFKICANHLLKSDMELTPLSNSKNAYIWVANDFADETVQLEKLCAKFKTPEEAERFRDAFNEAKQTCGISPTKSKHQSDVKEEKNEKKTTKDTEKVSFGGFTFTSTPAVKTPPNISNKVEEKKKETQPTPFADFSFTPRKSSETPAVALNTTKEMPKFSGILKQPLLSTPETLQPKTLFKDPLLTTPTLQSKSISPVSQPKSILKDSVQSMNMTEKSQSLPFTLANKNVLFEDEKYKSNKNESPSLKELLSGSSSAPIIDFADLSKMNDSTSGFKINTDGKTQFEGAGSKVFGRQKNNSESEIADDFIPTAEFKPVVPLPDLVDVKTGEEGQIILFEERAKLYRYDSNTKEWKERGVGNMKILKDPTTGAVRFLMRREQVLKLCCNHRITNNLEIKSHLGSDRAWTWHAQDYAEGEMKAELFVLRFKNSEQAQLFKQVVDQVLSDLNKEPTQPLQPSQVTVSSPIPSNVWKCQCLFPNSNDSSVCRACKKPKPRNDVISPKLSEWSRPKLMNWECSNCYSINESKESECTDCGSEKSVTRSSPRNIPLSEISSLKSEPGSWECKECYCKNKSGANICEVCQSNKPAQTGTQKPISELFKPKPGSWSCSVCYLSNDETTNVCPACLTPKLGDKTSENVKPEISETSLKSDSTNLNKPDIQLSLSEMFKPKEGSWECSGCLVRNESDKLICPACNTPKPGHQPNTENKGFSFGFSSNAFTFGIPTNETSKSGFNFQKSLGTMSFGTESSSNRNEKTGFNFGIPDSNSTTNLKGESTNKTPFAFGGQDKSSKTTTTFQFATTEDENKKETENQFSFGTSNNFEFNFGGIRGPNAQKSPVKNDSESENEVEEEDDGDHIYFQPVIPLPDKVEVKTGEEEEEVMYTHRAKLYRYTAGEWKERGLGDIKILKNLNTMKIRLLMRREPIMKLCLNHFLTQEITFTPKDDRAWLWTAIDYSEEQLKPEKFCLRFKTPEIAHEFIESIRSAQKEIPAQLTEVTTEIEVSSTSNTEAVSPANKITESPEMKSFSFTLPSSTTNSPTSVESPAMKSFSFTLPGSATGSPFSLSSQFGKSPAGLSPGFKSMFGGSSQNQSPDIDKKGTPEIKTLYDSKTSSGENYLEVIYENEVTPEELEEALKLNLPPKFYAYRRAPPCPGCIGCEPDDDEETNGNVSTNKTIKSSELMYEVCPDYSNPPLGDPVVIVTKPITETETVKKSSPLVGSPLLPNPTSKSTQNSETTAATTTPGPNKSFFGDNVSFNKEDKGKESATSIFGGTSKSILESTPLSSESQKTESKFVFNLTPTTVESQNKPIFGQAFTFGGQGGSIFGGSSLTKSDKPSDNVKLVFGGTPSDSNSTDKLTKTPFSFGDASTGIGPFSINTLSNDVNKSQQPIGAEKKTGSQSYLNETPKNSNIFGGSTSFSFTGSGSSLFNPDSSPGASFATLAAVNNNSDIFANAKKDFSWASQGTPLFSNKKITLKKTEDESSEDEGCPEQDQHDPHFEPIVPLPDAIEVRTGEEDEIKEFCQRAKLYRYINDTKEWKERGVGEIKILWHPINRTYRLLMRREQVHKVVCNHLLNESIVMKPMINSETSLTWGAMNLSDEHDEPVSELLAVKFKNHELCIQFKEKVEDCIQKVGEYKKTAIDASSVINTSVVEGNDEDDNYEEEEDDDDYEGTDEDNDYYPEDYELLFETEATVSIKSDTLSEWELVGSGSLQVVYDRDYLLSRILLKVDNNETELINSIITGDSVMNQITEKEYTWSGEEGQFLATFQSIPAAEEFKLHFKDGINFADKALSN